MAKLNRKQRNDLRKLLYQDERAEKTLYAIVDAAKDGSIPYFLGGLKASFQSLIKGEKAEELASVAPYIVKLEDRSNTVNWYLERVYGNGLGFILWARSSIDELANFWSKKVRTEIPGSEVKGYFRFYDPAILRDYIDILQEEGELAGFFGQCDSLLVEDSNPEKLISYSRSSADSDIFSSKNIDLAEAGKR